MRGTQRPKKLKSTVLRLIRCTGAFKFLWPAVFFCVLIGAAAEVLGTYLIKPVINDFIVPFIGSENPPLEIFRKYILILTAVYTTGAFSSFVSQRLLVKISTATLCKIRKDLFSHVSKMPVSFFDLKTHGEIMSFFTNDTDTIRDMFSQSIPQLLSGIFQVAGVFIMMLVLSVPLTCVMVTTVAAMLFIGAKIGKKSGAAYASQQKNIGALNGYIEELIEGQKVVKVFCREEESERQFDEFNERLRAAGTKAATYASVLGPVMNNFSHFQYALVAVFSAVLAINGFLDLGTIASFLQSTRAFSRPLSQLSQQFNAVLNALAGAERIFSVMDEDVEKDFGNVRLVRAFEVAARGGEPHRIVESFAYTGTWGWKNPALSRLKKLEGDVVFKDVTFSYDGTVSVLNKINIHAHPGDKIALVGSTGSGKTTVTNLLMRFYDLPDSSGQILFDGIPVKDIKKSDLRKSLAFVLQDTHLFSGTIMENVRYGNLDAPDCQVKKACELANADEFINHLPDGYETVIFGDGENLSQGQRQLLAIARAAVALPPVLILDEATSSIDTRTETLIEKGMDSLMKGRTVFVIAHRLSTVRNADMIIVLEHGNIVEQGTHEQLLSKRGRYYKLYTGAFTLS